jgi:hypothetical protein
VPSLADVFRSLNDLKAAGIVEDYAVGGAMAALFYAEVTRTYDLDVFVLLPPQPGTIVRLTSIYEWAARQGFPSQGEHILIHEVPVQFLVADIGVENEAILHARAFEYQGVPLRVVSPEHLVALFLRAGGERRRERVSLLVEAGVIDPHVLDDILARHHLQEEWQRRFGDGSDRERGTD